MYPIPGDQVTIIGGSYFQPIADLVNRLAPTSDHGANDVQVGSSENGYSVSIILLLVTMFESYAMRVRYINRQQHPIEKNTVVGFIQDLYPDFKQIDELTEVFSLRDLIAHNHLWKIDFEWSESPGMTLKNAKREVTAGDKKYHGVIDEKSRRTKGLALNIIPTKVGREDVRTVFKVIWDALIFLEKKDRSQCYVSQHQVSYNRRLILFSDLISKIARW